MLNATGLQYNRTQIHRPDGSFYSIVEVTAQGLNRVEFHKGINESRERKLSDVAHLRILTSHLRGNKQPIVIVWDAYGHGSTLGEFVPSTVGMGTVHVSKNSVITKGLRELIRSQNYLIEDSILKVKDCSDAQGRWIQSLLGTLYAEKRIQVVQADPSASQESVYASLDPYRDLIAVGQLGFPSTYARSHRYPVVFNTSYFLFEEEDFVSHFSLYGDAYNLQIRDGMIESPPLHNRSALLFCSDGSVETKTIALQDLQLSWWGKDWDLNQYKVYTRFSTVPELGKTMTSTPQNPGFIDFVIIDRFVVGYKHGGGIEIPHNGFVLSVPLSEIPRGTMANEVHYSFRDGKQYRTAIQCGPGLIRAGQVILDENTLSREQFFRKRIKDGKVEDYGVVPTDYAPDIHSTRAARTAIGVDEAGNFKILVAESVNKGMEESYGESSGVTLQELAEIAKAKGLKYALNLDGGGSATIYYQYGQLTKGADRRCLPGVAYERMVPSVGVVCN